MIGAAKLVDKVKDGKAKLEGNIQVLEQLKATLVVFDPLFEILPGTKPAAAPAGKPGKEEVFEDDAPVVKEPLLKELPVRIWSRPYRVSTPLLF